MGDTTPPFVIFRTPQVKPAAIDVYDRALDLSAQVHEILEASERTRFHLKDRLDRCVTALVVELGRAKADVKPGRWRYYRAALKLATDCVAVLDILERQKLPAVAAARDIARALVDQLDGLALSK